MDLDSSFDVDFLTTTAWGAIEREFCWGYGNAGLVCCFSVKTNADWSDILVTGNKSNSSCVVTLLLDIGFDCDCTAFVALDRFGSASVLNNGEIPFDFNLSDFNGFLGGGRHLQGDGLGFEGALFCDVELAPVVNIGTDVE